MTKAHTQSTSRPLIALVVALAVGLTLALPAPPSSAAATCFGKDVTRVGTSGNDTLQGTAGADVIAGLGGRDEIFGKGGRDLICGDHGNDYIEGGGGNDRVDGGRGSEQIFGDDGEDRLLGRGGDDKIFGDYFPTQEFDDYINGGANSAFEGDWVYFTGRNGAFVLANLEGETAQGEGQDTLRNLENVYGTDANDTLIGDDNPNYLVGDGGDDAIWGRDGNDAIEGDGDGATTNGNDGLFGGGGTWDWLAYFHADAAVTVDLEERTTTGGAGTDEHSGFELVIGSRFNDQLYGDPRTNYLAGRAGDDHLDGRDGYDIGTFYNPVDANLETGISSGPTAGPGPDGFAEGTDTLVELEGLWGSDAPGDTLTGDGNNNLLRGGRGSDTLEGMGGDDYFLQDPWILRAVYRTAQATTENDTILGGAGEYDLIDYSLFSTGVSLDLADASPGTSVASETGVEGAFGTIRSDTLKGDGGANYFFGAGRADKLVGRAGNDGLSGGPGKDNARGGLGDDTCFLVERGDCEDDAAPLNHPLFAVGDRVARAERRYK